MPIDRKKRVLQVITRLTIGGDTNVVLDIASHLNSRPDFEAHLAVGPVPGHEVDLTHLAFDREIPTRVIPSLTNRLSPMRNFQAVWQLSAMMRQGQYDIVHTHSSVAGVAGRLAAVVARAPVVVHHVHGWGLQEGMSAGMRTLYLGLEKLCSRFTDRMIAVSGPTIQKGLAHRICPEDKFALIYNGIDLDKFRQPVEVSDVLRELGLDSECKVVGMIGRLEQQKNPLDFIRAAAIVTEHFPQARFLIAGDGSLRLECERLIGDLGLQGVFLLLGFRNDIPRIMSALTLTVMSSLWEGLPVAFQEAMSAGKPIVANDVGGASDVVVDGQTGYLVTPHEPKEMADRILQLLNDERLCRKMGDAARKRSERFSKQRMTADIVALYEELLAAADGRGHLRRSASADVMR